MLEQCLTRSLLGDLRSMLENRFEVTVLPHELRSRLVANATHTGNVVRRIADERQIISDEFGRDTEAIFSVIDIYPMLLDVGGTTTARIEKPYSRANKL